MLEVSKANEKFRIEFLWIFQPNYKINCLSKGVVHKWRHGVRGKSEWYCDEISKVEVFNGPKYFKRWLLTSRHRDNRDNNLKYYYLFLKLKVDWQLVNWINTDDVTFRFTTTTTVFGERIERKGNVFPEEFGWNFRTERKIFRLMKILRLLQKEKCLVLFYSCCCNGKQSYIFVRVYREGSVSEVLCTNMNFKIRSWFIFIRMICSYIIGKMLNEFSLII